MCVFFQKAKCNIKNIIKLLGIIISYIITFIFRKYKKKYHKFHPMKYFLNKFKSVNWLIIIREA